MKTCNNKIKHTCTGSRTFAVCTQYEGTVNEDSALVDESCLSVEETTQDIYDQIGAIKNNQDLSELGEKCLTYVEDEDGKIIVKNVLLKMEDEICALKTQIETLEKRTICDLKISDCNIDLKCLEEDECNQTIVTLADWIQAVTNKICE